MSGSVGTMRAGSNRQSGTKDKMTKSERSTSSQQQSQSAAKTEAQSAKMQPTQEQLRLAQMMDTKHSDADPGTVKELMEMTDKSEEDVRIALHDAENDANLAVMILLEGTSEQQGEWREQGKRKKKVTTSSSQKDGINHVGEENFEGRNKDKGDRDENDREGGSDHHDLPPRRGRRNGGPPPRLARGRGRDRGNFGDRDNKDRNTEDWNNDRGEERRDRSGGERGRSRGRGGFSGRRSGGPGLGRGRFNNSGDRDSRSYNRVPRLQKLNNSQPMDGPEIDTWTNETAETNTSKDADWDNWTDTWVNEDDQWTGSLEETKVFTPSQMKAQEPEPSISEPSRGQRVDVGSLFIESAKFSKAPDYSKPSGDAYINQFNQAATESIKNTIGIGSSSRPPQSIGSYTISHQSVSNSLGLSSLTQTSEQVQVAVFSSLSQQGSESSVSQAMTHLSQIGMVSQQTQIGGIAAHQQNSSEQVPLSQSRIQSVMQHQQQQQQNMPVPNAMTSNSQQRPKPQKSKLPPPSKIPASAVEMPGHIPHNPQLDLQFGIDFGSDSSSSFGFGTSNENVAVTSAYSATTNGTSVITSQFSQAHISKSSNDGNTFISGIMSSPSAGSAKVPSSIESQQSSRQPAVFHNSVYTSSPPVNEPQNLDRDQNKVGSTEPVSYSSQLEHKPGSVMTQRTSQTNQNLSSGSLSQSKSEATSSYSAANGYAPSSYQNHQKNSSITPTQAYTTNTQVSQPSSFQIQYTAGQSVYPSAAQSQYSNATNAVQFPSGQPSAYNTSQNQYSSGQNQFASVSTSSHPQMPLANHTSQYSSGPQNSYTGGQSQYSNYQSSNAFPSHPSSQNNYSSSNQTSGSSSSVYLASTQPSSYTSQAASYQSPSVGAYHARDTQTGSSTSTQSGTGVSFQSASQSSLKAASSQTNTNYNSPNYSAPPATLQPALTNKLGDGLSKMTLKDDTTLDSHQSSQYDHTSTAVTTVSTSLSLSSATSTASLSTGTTTISSTSTATSITSTSRIASMPSTSKAPPNLPPGVPLMGQYIMGQSTMPPFYSVQPPLYGYEDVQLLQQRMPLQTGSYYDMSAFPAPAGSTLPAGRDQQPPIPNVPYTGTTADASKMGRVDPQSPNNASQPQNAHSATQQPLFNFHYGYYYPSMFPGGGLQYPMFPIPPVTNAAAHAGTTANTQFQKTYAPHVYTTKGYDDLNQAQDFSKTGYGSSPTGGKASGTRTGSSELTPNTYNKSHTQTYDKQGFHGGTPPPFNLPIASATQAGPMGGPTTPYPAAPFLPIISPHQLHHPIQQDSSSSGSRGLNQTGSQVKTGAGKSYGAPYWNN